MKPTEICQSILGVDKLKAILEELSSIQSKAVLKEGKIKINLPAGFVSSQKKRQLWVERILAAINQDNQYAAAELLQQWLLNHRRPMLISYLDLLGVKHRQGETDENFLVSAAADKVQSAATTLFESSDPIEATAYLTYVAFQQRSDVFEGWEPMAKFIRTASAA